MKFVQLFIREWRRREPYHQARPLCHRKDGQPGA